MAKLNQIIAVEGGVKQRAERSITNAYQVLQKAPLLEGISRTYVKKDEDGDDLPGESTLVQLKADEVISAVGVELTELFDVTAQKSFANTTARADVVINGEVIVENAPVDYLLFLEKQLVGIHTFISKLPALSPEFQWVYDENNGAWRTDPVQTAKTKKIPRVLEKAPATPQHPAQVDVWHEDVVVGTWNTTRFSGALPADRIKQLKDRVEELQKAVKFAREQANSIDAPVKNVGEKVFNYLFA
jgi:hypothetical protein